MAQRLTHAVLLSAVAIGVLGGCAQSTDKAPGLAVTGTRTAADSVVAERALLSPEEFGQPGWRLDLTRATSSSSAGAAGDASAWALAMPYCAAYHDRDYPARAHRIAGRTRGFVRNGQTAHQWVERFASGWGTRGLDDARRVIEACTRYEYSGPGQNASGFLETQAIEDSGFAGDDSILIRADRLNLPGKSESRYTVVVRRADLVVTLTATGLNADTARHLARQAASHLT